MRERERERGDFRCLLLLNSNSLFIIDIHVPLLGLNAITLVNTYTIKKLDESTDFA